MYTQSARCPPLKSELLSHWSHMTETLLLCLDVNDRVVSGNPAARRWCQAALHAGSSWWLSCPAYAAAALQDAVNSARCGVRGNVVVKQVDPARHWTFSVTPAPGGGVILEGHDVTALQQSQDQVSWWEACFEHLPVAVTFYDTAGCQLFGNVAYRELVGTLAPLQDVLAADADESQVAAPLQVDAGSTVCVRRGASDQHLSLQSCPVERHGIWTGDLVMIRDITSHRGLERRLTYQATHDELTGLLNRSALETNPVTRASPRLNTMIFIDLDDFKKVNDTWGHAAGDSVLQAVACRLRRWQEAGEFTVRWGGDEFVALIGATTSKQAQRRAEVLLSALQQPVQIGTQTVSVTACIGVVRTDAPLQRRVTDLIARADTAMYAAKRSGKNTVQVELPLQSPADDSHAGR